MRILIATDAFPPGSGGSGWSTYELAKGLRAKGHEVVLVQPYSESSPVPPGYDGFTVSGYSAPAPRVPFLRNYFRNERLYPKLARHLAHVIGKEGIELIHAQHVLTAPAAVIAASQTRIPSVCTVRDYWPLCYWSDLLVDPDSGSVCSGCSASAMTRCVRPRARAFWPAAIPMIPYMRANLRRKQSSLAGADAIVAVSRRVAADLRRHAQGLTRTRIETIPNGVDVAAVRAAAKTSSSLIQGPYALFVGKLAKNKGAHLLVDVAERARLQMPLVVVGDGPERSAIEQAAVAAQRDLRVVGWQGRDEVFRWMSHASLLIFPSNCLETLSRVLIEASALGVAIAAMNTGGTEDIVVHESTGLLSTSVAGLAADVVRLTADADLRARLGDRAAARAQSEFDLPVVVTRMETLYQELVHGS